MRFVSASVALFASLLLRQTTAAQFVYSGSGLAATTSARDNFRSNIGGATTPGPNGSFFGVRREINWDAVPPGFSAPNNLPANFFNVNSPRGVVFTTSGSGFQVSAATTDNGASQPAPPNFGNIDASYTATFTPFSPQRLFTGLGSNIVDVTFFIPGTDRPGTVRAFGAVFSDVDLANTTSIEYFDTSGNSLGKFFVPPATGNQTVSFLGVLFADPIVGRVRISNGNVPLGAGVIDTPANDVVTMDDFIYSEPVPAATMFAGAGVTAATTARDNFRSALGGGTTAGANGSFGGVRREINWDAVPATFAAPNNLPEDFFNVNSPRGVLVGGFNGTQVSGATTDNGAGQPAPQNFGNIDPSYTTTFAQFSPQRLFTPLPGPVVSGEIPNSTFVDFFVPGTTTAGLVNGFGCIFSDVDQANTTAIEYFDALGRSLGKFYAPSISGNQTVSFLGVVFPEKIVGHVRITTGNAVPAPGVIDSGTVDVVVMDDFIYGEPIAAPAQLLNLSTRARVLTGDKVSIAGFIVVAAPGAGTSVLLRGLGPSLTNNGVPGALQDPVIEVYSANSLVRTNDNWKIDDKTGSSQQNLIEGSGLAPTDERESALVFFPDRDTTYTVVLRGKNSATGVGVAEVYDQNQFSKAALANISGRAFIDTGDNALFGGFISGAGGGAPTRIVIRGIGPSLAAVGVPGALQDPTLEVFNNNGALVASNDDWKLGGQQSDIQGTGLAPSDDREAAIVSLLPGGTFTAIVRGKNNTTGVGLVEIYHVR